MKKAIVTTLVSLALSSTVFAATPDLNVEPGQIGVGYTNYKLSTEDNLLGDLGSFKVNNYQAAYGLSDKIALTGDYLSSEKRNFYSTGYGYHNDYNYSATKLGLEYKLNDNLAFSVGNVKSEFSSSQDSSSTNEIFGGVSYNTAITNNLNGYASYLKSKNTTDAKIGVQHAIGTNAAIDINYRDYQDSLSGITAKGVGFGVNYKF